MLIQIPASVPGLKSATIRHWAKQAGQSVKAGEILVELETEDSLVHLQAPVDGALTSISAEAGQTLTPGQEIGQFSPGAVPAQETLMSPPPSPAPVTSATPSAPPSGVPILMPQAGNTMEEGTLVKWRVKVGDAVIIGQIICEVETDKATVEVESTAAGKIAWLAAEGAVIPVKQPIALLGDAPVSYAAQPTTEVSKSTPKPTAEVIAKQVVTDVQAVANRTDSGRIKASPAARKLAVDKGLDLANAGPGSGPQGRILTTDLAHAKPSAKPASAPQVTGAKEVAPAGPMGALSGGRKALSKMRKAIAVNLQASKQTIPHFYVKLTINADPLFAFYRAQKPATGCTLNDVLLLAVGRVVGEFPAFRCRLEGGDIIENPASNIGVAVSVPDGLVVPVVMNVHALTLAQLAVQAKLVVESARGGKIENMGKGVFTISNMGMLGVEEFSAIINPPESGILAISAVREAVLVKDGAMRPGRVMTLTLSVDHRVVDGALAAQFMGRLCDLLENPRIML